MGIFDAIKNVATQFGSLAQLPAAKLKESKAKEQAIQLAERTARPYTPQPNPRVVKDLQTAGYSPAEATRRALTPIQTEAPDPLFNAISTALNIPNKAGGLAAETLAGKTKAPGETLESYYQRSPSLTDIAGNSLMDTSKKVFGEEYGTPLGSAGMFIAALTLDPFNLVPFGAGDDVVKLLAKEKNATKVLPYLKQMKVSDDLIEGVSEAVAKASTPEEVKSVLGRAEEMMKTTKNKFSASGILSKQINKADDIDLLNEKYTGSRLKPDAWQSSRQRGIRQTAKEIMELDPLTLEARKYKSAEEFVKEIAPNKGAISRSSYENAKLLNSSNQILAQGHILDNLPKKTPTVDVPINKFAIETEAYGKVASNKIAVHSRPLKGITGGKLKEDYWDKQIAKGERPPILVGVKDGQIRVLDGNNRLNAYMRQGVKDVPVIYANDTKSQLTDIWNKANDQMTRSAKQADVLGEGGSRLPRPKPQEQIFPVKEGGIKPPSGSSLSDQLLRKTSRKIERTLPQGARELEVPLPTILNQRAKNAILKTAESAKEPVSTVKRVVDSVRKTFTGFAENVQDSQIRVKKLLSKEGVKVTDASDPYLRETLYHGRVADKVEQGRKEAESIIKATKEVADSFKSSSKEIRKELNDYLLYKHAPERNLALGEKAAGVTTQEAEAGLKAILSSPRGAEIKKLAERAAKLNEQTLDLLKESGVISDELYTILRTKYKNHVPLQRVFEETEDMGSVLAGRGFDVRSTGIKRAIGSEREVDDILGNIVTNYEQAVLRSEKNIVDQATLAFARDNKDILGDLLEVKRPKAIGRMFEPGSRRITLPSKSLNNEAISMVEAEIEAIQNAIDDLPASQLWKYANKNNKELPEIIGKTKSKFGREGDSIIGELYGFDVEESVVLKDFDDVVKMRSQRDELLSKLKELKKGGAYTQSQIDSVNSVLNELYDTTERAQGRLIVERTTDPSILQMFEKGRPVWIKINDPALAVALKGVGREKLPALFRTVGAFTRLYAGLATRFNPEFALPNKIRDLQETAVYLASQKDVGFKGASRAVAKDPKSVKGVLDAIRGVDSEGAKLYNEMKSLGGTTGGFGLSTREQTRMSLDRIEKLANSKTRQIANNLVEYVDDWNTIFEDSTRLSVYRQGLEQGLSKERAAFLAKEASINFNRMGKGGPVINALWMFSNASIQGSAKMIRALKNPKVLGATVLAVGGSVAAVNQWNDQLDPEWRSKVSKWDRLNGLPIVLPSPDGEGVKYVTIPVSWGIKPIKVMADYAYDAVSGQDFNVQDMMSDTGVAMMEAYNPVGGSDLASALAPTILDVPLEIKSNRAWTGNKLRPDFDQNAPADIQYFRSLGETKTGQTAISISELLKDKAGISISPANIKYAFDQYIGGAGRAISKTVNTITGGIQGKIPPPDEYPIISRFYRERTEEEVGSGSGGQTDEIKKILEKQSSDRFDVRRQAEALDKELSSSDSQTANERVKELKSENPALYEKLKDVYQERRLGLTYTEKLMKQLGVENGERAKYIHSQIMSKPKAERQAYYEELKTKKVISKEVAKQLKQLQND